MITGKVSGMTENEKMICLTTERELRIFMDPLRQRILECMEIAGVPMTAKKLADTLGIAPSSAKHHLNRLESIGVVLEDHKETIHGIVATFYRMTDKNVGLDSEHQGLWEEKRLIMENQCRMVQNGFFNAMCRQDETLRQLSKAERAVWQDENALGTRFEAGVVHLTPAQLQQVNELIQKWTAIGHTSADDTIPVRYCFISYEAEADVGHDDE